jgi:hypothetical protein
MTQPGLSAVHALRQRYGAYIADQTRTPFLKRYGQEATMIFMVVGLTICVLLERTNTRLLLLPGGLTLIRSIRSIRKKSAPDVRRKLAETGIPVWGVLVQANQMLFQPGDTDLPCLVLFSFEPLGGQIATMQRLAHRVFAFKGTQQTDPDLAYIANLTTDERAYRYRRRQLPLSFTGGATIYCADLFVQRSCLASGYLMGRVLPCLAEPGDSGVLELLPWWMASPQDDRPDSRSE